MRSTKTHLSARIRRARNVALRGKRCLWRWRRKVRSAEAAIKRLEGIAARRASA